MAHARRGSERRGAERAALPLAFRDRNLPPLRDRLLPSGAVNRTLVGILIGIAFFAALVYTTLEQSSVECRVCITYKGRTQCETVKGSDRALAQMQATSTACTFLSSGVTDSIACSSTPPDVLECSQ